MKYLITGINGQLGYDIIRELKLRGIEEKNIIGVGHKEMDITDESSVHQIITQVKPDVVFHNAAYTKVDLAEDNYEECYKVNGLGPKYIAEACKEVDAKLIHISTDYVFNGKKDGFYMENDIPNPINVYGKTKYLGELNAMKNPKTYIVRISWVFGINGNNFIKTMLRLSKTNNKVRVVDDQIGSPTYTVDISKLLVDMSEADKYGIYHATNEGVCSWKELAEYVFKSNAIDMVVEGIPTSEYKTKATRPMNSRMSKNKLEENGFERLPDWHDAVDRYNIELKSQKILRK